MFAGGGMRTRKGTGTDYSEAGMQGVESWPILARSSQLGSQGRARTIAMRLARDLHHHHVEIQVATGDRQRPPARENASTADRGMRSRDV